MNTVQPHATITLIHGGLPSPSAGRDALRFIEHCGRISHRSEESQTEDSWERFIKATVMGHGDWSIVEHASATVDMLVDRGITHELVRHRLFSYTQESTRFVNYQKKMPPSFIKPFTGQNPGTSQEQDIWETAVGKCEEAYKDLVHLGVSPQIARSVFPNALASRILMTGNLRSWRHFFLMRTTKESHPQMRQVTIPLLADFQHLIPLLYDDIEPNATQSANLAKPK